MSHENARMPLFNPTPRPCSPLNPPAKRGAETPLQWRGGAHLAGLGLHLELSLEMRFFRIILLVLLRTQRGLFRAT